jgi:Tfp pilus assembly protein PilO
VSEETKDWHLDKKVPISILILVFVQLLGFLWSIRKDVELLKLGQAVATDRDTRQDRTLADSISMLRADIQILTAKVDRLVEGGNGKKYDSRN